MTRMNPKERLLPPNSIFILFYFVNVSLDIDLEGKFLELESEDKLQLVSH